VTLIGKARAHCDFSQARSPVANEFNRALQSQVHDITVRRHADGSGEHARKVELATSCYFCERRDLDGFIKVGNDIVT
jgi:hypothetical protein